MSTIAAESQAVAPSVEHARTYAVARLEQLLTKPVDDAAHHFPNPLKQFARDSARDDAERQRTARAAKDAQERPKLREKKAAILRAHEDLTKLQVQLTQAREKARKIVEPALLKYQQAAEALRVEEHAFQRAKLELNADTIDHDAALAAHRVLHDEGEAYITLARRDPATSPGASAALAVLHERCGPLYNIREAEEPITDFAAFVGDVVTEMREAFDRANAEAEERAAATQAAKRRERILTA